MSSKMFRICYSHLEQSAEEITSLARVLEDWTSGKNWSLEPQELFYSPGRTEWRIAISDLPAKASVLAASALHNMRVPLDQMLAIHYRRSTGQSDARPLDISFPARRDKESFFKAITTLRRAKLPPEAVDFVTNLEAFPLGRGGYLSLISTLDIDSKHHGLLAVESRLLRLRFEGAKANRGILYSIGQVGGQIMYNRRPGVAGQQDLVAPSDEARPILREEKGRSYLEFAVARPSDPVLVTSSDFPTLNSVFLKPDLHIFFQHALLREHEVIHFLRLAHKTASNTVTSFIEATQ